MSENKAEKLENPDHKLKKHSIIKRVIIAVIFLPCIVIIARRGGLYFLSLVTLMIFAGLWEYYRMVETKGLKPYKLIGIAGGTLLPFYIYFFNGKYANGLLLLITFLAITISELGRKKREFALYHISVTLFGMLYVGWLGSYLVMLRELPIQINLDYKNGFLFVILVFVLTWCYDTGAYILGMIAGKHKLFPDISPGKTVEGAIGGVVLAIIGILVARKYVFNFLNLWEAVGLAFVASVMGQLGDLVESMIKRDINIKDSSNTIPGHGGILDRFDSILFNAPVIYYILRYFFLNG